MGWKRFWMAGAATVGITTAVGAQLPALAQPAPPPPNPVGIAPYPQQPGSPTVWDKLGVSKAQQEYCRRGTCRTPFGQMMNGVVSPFSKLSGGLIPPFCPVTPSLAELQDPGAVGAAAKVKQDRAGAEERIKAVRYLGTVDCHYWPEAEEALIGALRNDRNECVRYEAAVVLGKGCCCTPKVIIALSNAVACSTSDGGFLEKSARVRTAAQAALEHCMPDYCACPDITPLQFEDDKKKKQGGGGGGEVKPMSYSAAEAKPGPNGGDIYDNLRSYYTKVGTLPKSEVVRYATQAMTIGSKLGTVDSTMNVYDLQAAGVPLKAEGQVLANAPRPKNLWDMMTGGGSTSQTPTMAYAPMAVTARKETMTAMPSAYAPMPKAIVQTQEPPVRKSLMTELQKEKAPTLMPVSTPATQPRPMVTSMADPKPAPLPVAKPAPMPAVAPVVVKKEVPVVAPVVVQQTTMAPVVMVPSTPAPMAEVMVPVAPQPTRAVNSFPEEPVSLRPAIPARR